VDDRGRSSDDRKSSKKKGAYRKAQTSTDMMKDLKRDRNEQNVQFVNGHSFDELATYSRQPHSAFNNTLGRAE
jgi:hypothetical protein